MFLQKIKARYIELAENRELIKIILTSLLIFLLSLVIEYFAGIEATENASSPVRDIILSNIPVYDVGALLTYGSIIFWTFLTLLCIYWPKKAPFTLKSLALFIIIRSLFVNMTHLGIFPNHVPFNTTGMVSYFTFGGDLFFSGHTGTPFLLALIFWENKTLRYIFLACSVSFGTLKLLAHQHYTIDVLSAFFITYTIYHLAEKFFKEDKNLAASYEAAKT